MTDSPDDRQAERTAHILHGDGVTETRFSCVEGTTFVNMEEIQMSPGDVIDFGGGVTCRLVTDPNRNDWWRP